MKQTHRAHDMLLPRLLAIMLGSAFIAPAQAWVLTGSSWASGEATVYVDLETTNPAGSNPPNVVASGPTTAQLDTAYIEAMALWTNNSTFKYTATTSGAVVDPCAGSNSGVKFANTSCSGAFGTNTLAVQTTYFSVPSNNNTRTVTVFNNSKQWDLYTGNWTGVAEFKRVAVHELGHGLGLDHSIFNSIMYFQAGDIETPQADDLAGAAALYDIDGDGIGLADDNCPDDSNSSQLDTDGDMIGDACDGDIDGDGIFDSASIDASWGVSPVGNSFWAAGPASSNSAFPYMAQSFIANITGSMTRIDLPLYCPSGDMTLEVRSTSGEQPTSTVLSSSSYSAGVGVPTTNSGVQSFTLSSAVAVSSGTRYAIVINLLGQGECRWFSAGSYSDGAGYLSTNASFWQGIGDFAFQTFVDPMPVDNCPLDVNPLQEDSNNNGIGDACDSPDQDGDGIDDGSDNCPAVFNPLQENFDNDSMGDACDSDDDNDSLSDDDEINIYGSNPLNTDSDADGLADGDEVNTYGTNPADADTDDDTVNDGDEIANGTDPTIFDGRIPMLGTTGGVLVALLLLLLAARSYRQVRY